MKSTFRKLFNGMLNSGVAAVSAVIKDKGMPGKLRKLARATWRKAVEPTARVMKITLLWLTIFSPKMFHEFIGFGSWAL